MRDGPRPLDQGALVDRRDTTALRGRLDALINVQRAPLLVLAIGLIVTAIGALTGLEISERELQYRFHATAGRLARTVESEFQRYEDLLGIARVHFDTTAPNTRSEFQRYLAGGALTRNSPGAEWYAYVRRVRDQDLPWYERVTQSDLRVDESGVPMYRPKIAARRPEYFFVEQTIPPGEQPQLLGFDIAANAELADAIEAARRADAIVAVTGERNPLTADGLPVLLAPVFESLAETPRARGERDALAGIIAMKLNTAKLLRAALADTVPAGFAVRVYLGSLSGNGGPQGRQLAYSGQGETTGAARADEPERLPGVAALTLSREATIGQAKVRILVSGDRLRFAGIGLYWPVFVLLSGGVITGLLFLYVRGLAQSRQRAIVLAGRMLAEARRNEERFRNIVESSSDWIWEVDSRYRYVYASPNTSDILGYEPSELTGSPAEQFTVEVKGHAAPAFPFGPAEPRPYSGFERVLRRKDGEPITLESSGTPFFSDDGRLLGVRGIDRDVTARRRLRNRLNELQHELAEATQLNLVSQLLSGVAHELNQPLSAIVLFNQACIRMLEGREFTRNREVIEAMRATAAQAQLAGDIIKRLRRLTAKRDPQVARAGIAQLIQNALALTEYRLKHFQIQVEIDVPASLPEVQVDAVLITQAMLNLIHNAIDAMVGSDERHLRVSARVHGRGRIRVEFSDSGPGIPDSAAANLFDPYFTTKATGMGLGLTISRSILEAHEGELTFSRGPLGGAVFVMFLPAASPSAAKAMR